MNYGFVIDNRKCIGCHACTLACKSEHQVPIGVNRTHVKTVEKGQFPNSLRLFSVHRCNHCADAPCVEICPTTALFTRADGIVDFDNERCIGCKSCMQACPYDALYIDPETHTAAKCNYCTHRVDVGLEPACVIVCPVEAIVSGDLDDPESKIAKLMAREKVTVRKPEKGTRPKLAYVSGDDSVLDPAANPGRADYVWSQQQGGVGHFAARQAESSSRPVDRAIGLNGQAPSREAFRQGSRVYDAPAKGVLWGWEVAAYVWTKALATGLILVPALLAWTSGGVGPGTTRWALGLSLFFAAATAALLVKDLDRPDRFLYVLLRPQWRSWLVRGAYILTGFGLVVTAMFVAELAAWSLPWLTTFAVPLAVAGAAYTGFLFAQAKGRDLWQSPLLPLHMLLHAGLTGAAALLIMENKATGVLSIWVIWLIGLNLVFFALEALTPHVSADAASAWKLMTRGDLGRRFWFGILAGNVLPMGLLQLSEAGSVRVLAALLVLAGVLLTESARVLAPQRIPLS